VQRRRKLETKVFSTSEAGWVKFDPKNGSDPQVRMISLHG